MKLRTVFLLLILSALGVFSVLNWNAFVTPTTLSLGVAEIQAPLGVVMLGVTASLTAFFLIFVVYLQASALFESRRHAQELQLNRELADKAEASRFTELRAYIEGELQKLAGRGVGGTTAADQAILARIEKLEKEVLTALQHTENSLAAYVGELDDRLRRHDGRPLQP